MLVKGKRMGKPKLLDSNLAGAIGETPRLVLVDTKYLPSGKDVLFGEIMQPLQALEIAAEQQLTQLPGACRFTTCLQQCQQFISNLVRATEGLPVRPHPL